jgi:hypothetical protein
MVRFFAEYAYIYFLQLLTAKNELVCFDSDDSNFFFEVKKVETFVPSNKKSSSNLIA